MISKRKLRIILGLSLLPILIPAPWAMWGFVEMVFEANSQLTIYQIIALIAFLGIGGMGVVNMYSEYYKMNKDVFAKIKKHWREIITISGSISGIVSLIITLLTMTAKRPRGLVS